MKVVKRSFWTGVVWLMGVLSLIACGPSYMPAGQWAPEVRSEQINSIGHMELPGVTSETVLSDKLQLKFFQMAGDNFDAMVVLGTQVWFVDSKELKIVYHFEPEAEKIVGGFALSEFSDSVFLLVEDGQLRRYELNSGQMLWQSEVNISTSAILGIKLRVDWLISKYRIHTDPDKGELVLISLVPGEKKHMNIPLSLNQLTRINALTGEIVSTERWPVRRNLANGDRSILIDPDGLKWKIIDNTTLELQTSGVFEEGDLYYHESLTPPVMDGLSALGPRDIFYRYNIEVFEQGDNLWIASNKLLIDTAWGGGTYDGNWLYFDRTTGERKGKTELSTAPSRYIRMDKAIDNQEFTWPVFVKEYKSMYVGFSFEVEKFARMTPEGAFIYFDAPIIEEEMVRIPKISNAVISGDTLVFIHKKQVYRSTLGSSEAESLDKNFPATVLERPWAGKLLMAGQGRAEVLEFIRGESGLVAPRNLDPQAELEHIGLLKKDIASKMPAHYKELERKIVTLRNDSLIFEQARATDDSGLFVIRSAYLEEVFLVAPMLRWVRKDTLETPWLIIEGSDHLILLVAESAGRLSCYSVRLSSK